MGLINDGLSSRGRNIMRHAATVADRIDYWIRRCMVPCPAPGNVTRAGDRYVALSAIGQSLKDQYDALEAPVPPHLAALVERLQSQSSPGHRRNCFANCRAVSAAIRPRRLCHQASRVPVLQVVLV